MRLIDADALVEQFADKAKEMAKIAESSCGQAADYYSGIKTGFTNAAIVADSFPTIDAVPVGAYEQTRWERDTAIEQLAKIGKSLCEKMDDVARVKHGKWTKHTLPDCTYFICSLCGWESIDSKSIYDDDGWYVDEVGMNYCPNCGARMTE